MENTKSLLQTVQNTLTTADVDHKSTQQVLQEVSLDVETYMDGLKIHKEVQMSFQTETHKMFL